MLCCFVTQPIHPAGVERLQTAGIAVRFASSPDMETVRREIGDAAAVITRNIGIDAATLQAAPALRLVASHGAGVDRVDLAQARRQGVVVTNTPGANAQSVAEHTIGLMLALARRVTEADRALRNGDWGFRNAPGMIELHGKCLVLAGFGPVAQAVARIARLGLGMEVAAWSPNVPDDLIAAARVTPVGSLHALLAAGHFVSLHRPLRQDTANMINDAALDHVAPGTLLINTGRGGLIDIAALHRALEDGRIAGAALDVFDREPPAPDDPVMRLPRTILTPHLGGATTDALRATALLCANQVVTMLSGRTPEHVVQPAAN